MPRKEHKVLINIKDLTWGFPKTPSLMFDRFNFALYENDFAVLTGRSGTGKTTLIKLMTHRLKTHPKMIYHKMEDISRYGSKEIQNYRKNLGLISQHEQLISTMDIKENITYPLKLNNTPQNIIDKRYNELIKHFHLESIQDREIKSLSAGERKIVALLRALIHKPEFIIADEPTGDLDAENTKKIGDLLIQVNKEGNTILLVTHDTHLLEYLNQKHKVMTTKL